MSPARRARQRGFTMIELLITMLLLSISLTGLAALQVHAVRQTTATRRSNEATRLGQDVLERQLVGTIPAVGGWSLANNRAGVPMSGVGADGLSAGPFTVEMKVENGPAAGQAIITVRVYWRDVDAKAGGGTREVFMTTMRTP